MADELKTEVLDGKKIAEGIRKQAKQEVLSLAEAYPGFTKPKLVIIQVKEIAVSIIIIIL